MISKTVKRRLAASTLVETIIASVIFMCVFVISLETVSRLTVNESDHMTLIESDYRMGECFREYGDGKHEVGKYTKEYDWGSVTVRICPYGAYAKLQEVIITAEVKNISKRLELRHIVESTQSEE